MKKEQKEIIHKYNNGGEQLSKLGEQLKGMKGKFPDAKEAEQPEEVREVENNEQGATAREIADFFVSKEARDDYFENVKGGEERKKGAVRNFIDGLEKKLAKVDLANTQKVNEVAKKYANSSQTKLAEIIASNMPDWEGPSSVREEVQENEKSSEVQDGSVNVPGNEAWKKEPYEKIIENYLTEKIIQSHPDLEGLGRDHISQEVGRLAQKIGKMIEEEDLDIDLDGVSFGSVKDIHFFAKVQLKKNEFEYMDLIEKLAKQLKEKEANKKSEKNSEQSPHSPEEFLKKFEIGPFYVNKKDGSDLVIIDFNPKTNKVTFFASYKFKEEQPEHDPGEKEPIRVYSIESRGGKNVLNYRKFEQLMDDYVLEDKLHKEEFAKEQNETSAKFIEDIGQSYKNKKGTTLQLYKYKRGKKKGYVSEPGTVGVRVGERKIEFVTISEAEKLINDGGFEVAQAKEDAQSKEDPKEKKVQVKKTKKSVQEQPKEPEQLEFSEREKKMLKAYRKFSKVFLESVETFDYKKEGYLNKDIPAVKQRLIESFWGGELGKEMNKRNSFRNEELIEKAIEQISKTEK